MSEKISIGIFFFGINFILVVASLINIFRERQIRQSGPSSPTFQILLKFSFIRFIALFCALTQTALTISEFVHPASCCVYRPCTPDNDPNSLDFLWHLSWAVWVSLFSVGLLSLCRLVSNINLLHTKRFSDRLRWMDSDASLLARTSVSQLHFQHLNPRDRAASTKVTAAANRIFGVVVLFMGCAIFWASVVLLASGLVEGARGCRIVGEVMLFGILAYLSWSAFKFAWRMRMAVHNVEFDLLTDGAEKIENSFRRLFWLSAFTACFAFYLLVSASGVTLKLVYNVEGLAITPNVVLVFDEVGFSLGVFVFLVFSWIPASYSRARQRSTNPLLTESFSENREQLTIRTSYETFDVTLASTLMSL